MRHRRFTGDDDADAGNWSEGSMNNHGLNVDLINKTTLKMFEDHIRALHPKPDRNLMADAISSALAALGLQATISIEQQDTATLIRAQFADGRQTALRTSDETIDPNHVGALLSEWFNRGRS